MRDAVDDRRSGGGPGSTFVGDFVAMGDSFLYRPQSSLRLAFIDFIWVLLTPPKTDSAFRTIPYMSCGTSTIRTPIHR